MKSEKKFDGKNAEKDNEAIELSDEKNIYFEDETIKRIKNANELSKEVA